MGTDSSKKAKLSIHSLWRSLKNEMGFMLADQLVAAVIVAVAFANFPIFLFMNQSSRGLQNREVVVAETRNNLLRILESSQAWNFILNDATNLSAGYMSCLQAACPVGRTGSIINLFDASSSTIPIFTQTTAPGILNGFGYDGKPCMGAPRAECPITPTITWSVVTSGNFVPTTLPAPYPNFINVTLQISVFIDKKLAHQVANPSPATLFLAAPEMD